MRTWGRMDGHRRVYFALVIVALLQSAPLFGGLDRFGRRDWDQLSFRYETPRVALLRDHQLPLWNPYVNGGNVLLAHPASPFPSPWYLPVLALGAKVGLRVQVALFLVIGAVGAAVLLRRWGAPPSGSFVAGVMFMMSAHFSLHIAEGHLEWCVLGLMPWVILGLLRAEKDRRFIVLTGLLLASGLTMGSVYIIAIYVPFLALWAALESLRKRSWRLALAYAGALVVMGVTSAVKLLPQLEFASANPRPRKVAEVGLSARGLVPVFLQPRQERLYWAMRDVESTRQAAERVVVNGHRRDLPVDVAEPVHQQLRALGVVDEWHEYGAYATIPGLLLAVVGLAVSWRRMWPLYAAGAVAGVVMMSHSSPIDLWSLLQNLPLYRSLTVPSRFVAAVVLVLAVAAALGLGWIVQRTPSVGRWRRLLIVYGVPAVISAELLTLAWRLWSNIFRLPGDAASRARGLRDSLCVTERELPGHVQLHVPIACREFRAAGGIREPGRCARRRQDRGRSGVSGRGIHGGRRKRRGAIMEHVARRRVPSTCMLPASWR